MSLLQHAQYIHPDKRSAPESTSAIFNLAVKITSVLNNNNCLYKVFGVNGASTDSIIDQIRSQWQFFQNEDIKKEWYQLDEQGVSSSTKKDSYWARAGEMCEIESTPFKRNMKRIDDFWEKIDSLRDNKGSQKYPQLVALMKCVLSLSHGNSTPERGFSINKLILGIHGYSTYEDTLTALRFVKDELLSDVKAAHSRYEADRVARKEAQGAEQRRKLVLLLKKV